MRRTVRTLAAVVLALVVALTFTGCPPSTSTSFPVVWNAVVAQMIAAVKQADVEAYLKQLTGKTSITVGSVHTTLRTRNTKATTAIKNATQFAYNFMQAQGLAVSFHEWSDASEGVSGRNVVAQIDGTGKAGEIVLITAHLDDMPEGSVAPGADDDASGSVGVMMVAAQLAGHSFERTIRFILFTGEEYGPSGSAEYANDCDRANEDIVAVLNLDCIGWDDNDDGAMYLHTRGVARTGYRKDKAIADAFVDAVETYSITQLHTHIEASDSWDVDNASFWAVDYPGALAIEDEYDESNPNWHELTDTFETLNLPYCTNIIKGAVGTAAHLAVLAE